MNWPHNQQPASWQSPLGLATLGLFLLIGPSVYGQKVQNSQTYEKAAAGAGIFEIRTTINPLHTKASCERTGIIQLVADSDTVLNASPEDPLYIRLELRKDARLGETLVWSHISNQQDMSFQPIYIPILLDGGSSSGPNPITAAPDAISIVRWKEGETAIWLKIQSSPDTWINQAQPARMNWTIGTSARTTWEQSDNAHSNLLAATRNLQISEESDAVSTNLCVDLRESFLLPAPAPDRFSLLDYEADMFDSNTAFVESSETEGGIVLGNLLQDALYGDLEIGRGFILPSCETSASVMPSLLSAELCPDLTKGAPSGLIMLESEPRELFPLCHTFWGVHQESLFQLKVKDDAAYGFRILLDKFGQPVVAEDDPEKVMLDPNSLLFTNAPHGAARGDLMEIFQVPTGEYLSKTAEIAYQGNSTHEQFRLGFKAAVWGRIGGPSQQILLTQAFLPTDKDFEDLIDFEPFAGPDQATKCPPSRFRIELGDWDFGEFIACGFCNCPNDFDCDYVIGDGDLRLMYNQFFTAGTTGDLNQNGQVDVIDGLLLMNQYGSCID